MIELSFSGLSIINVVLVLHLSVSPPELHLDAQKLISLQKEYQLPLIVSVIGVLNHQRFFD